MDWVFWPNTFTFIIGLTTGSNHQPLNFKMCFHVWKDRRLEHQGHLARTSVLQSVSQIHLNSKSQTPADHLSQDLPFYLGEQLEHLRRIGNHPIEGTPFIFLGRTDTNDYLLTGGSEKGENDSRDNDSKARDRERKHEK